MCAITAGQLDEAAGRELTDDEPCRYKITRNESERDMTAYYCDRGHFVGYDNPMGHASCPSCAKPPVERLRLSHNPGEWDGTFAATALFMIGNVVRLDRLGIRVRWATEDGTEHEAQVINVDEPGAYHGALLTNDGRRIELDDADPPITWIEI